MHNSGSRSTTLWVLLSTAVLLGPSAADSAPPARAQHLRGTIESLNDEVVTVATPEGPVRVRLTPSTRVAAIVQSDRSQITDGSFLGITSVTDPNGSQRAVEVHVFPVTMRGTGEGSYGWDWPGAALGGSKMTNGTVAAKTKTGAGSGSKMTNGTVTGRAGETLRLEYQNGTADGSQTITIPPGVPVVALEPAQKADLQPGAHVFVVASLGADGALTADRILQGKNGLVPPM
jgi:hypothetical protein